MTFPQLMKEIKKREGRNEKKNKQKIREIYCATHKMEYTNNNNNARLSKFITMLVICFNFCFLLYLKYFHKWIKYSGKRTTEIKLQEYPNVWNDLVAIRSWFK